MTRADSNQADFSHAEAELTGTPWLAHLAAGSAAAAAVLAWVLLSLVAPTYLVPYAEQEVQLSRLAQLVLQGAVLSRAATGWILLLAVLAVQLLLWRRAARRGGLAIALLFVLEAVLLGVAVVVVLACALPLHSTQDLSR